MIQESTLAGCATISPSPAAPEVLLTNDASSSIDRFLDAVREHLIVLSEETARHMNSINVVPKTGVLRITERDVDYAARSMMDRFRGKAPLEPWDENHPGRKIDKRDIDNIRRPGTITDSIYGYPPERQFEVVGNKEWTWTRFRGEPDLRHR